MSQVGELYNLSYIAPGVTASLFIWGYDNKTAVNYSIVISSVDDLHLIEPHATISQGETFRWSVNGSIARKIYVTNHAESGTRAESGAIEVTVLEWGASA